MKKILAGIVLVGMMTGLAQFTGCNDPEPDPCKEIESLAGSFTMGERITNYGGVDTVIVSDTVITENFVVFRADTTYESYEWKIGDDLRTFTSREVSLRFMQPQSSVQIRLIAKWKPNKTCFPQDDGVDTVYKYLTVVDKKLNPIFGKYEGALVSNPIDFYTVEITANEYFDRFTITNINKSCEVINGLVPMRFGYKIVSISKHETANFYEGLCKNPIGWASIDHAGNQLVALYSVGNGSRTTSETNRSSEKFIGKKY
jgi:hypothetical protein